MRSIVVKVFSVVLVCYAAFHWLTALGQNKNSASCSIIDINKDSGSVLIRNNTMGWIKMFRPSPLEFAELAVGDSVEASLSLNQVSRIKDKQRVYRLLQPSFGSPCCEIIRLVARDSLFIVSARTSTGDSLRFTVSDTANNRFPPGMKVYSSPSHGFAMILSNGKDSTDKLFIGYPYSDD